MMKQIKRFTCYIALTNEDRDEVITVEATSKVAARKHAESLNLGEVYMIQQA